MPWAPSLPQRFRVGNANLHEQGLSEEPKWTCNTRDVFSTARVSRAGARTGLQLPGHGDMQGFNSSSPAKLNVEAPKIGGLSGSAVDWHGQQVD